MRKQEREVEGETDQGQIVVTRGRSVERRLRKRQSKKTGLES